jgi:hypothetical protein
VPILLGTAVALSQGGAGPAWWRRLPPARTVAWLVGTFLVLSAASALMAHLDTVGVVAVAGLAGVVDARAWYGLASAAVRRSVTRPLHPWHWRATLQQIQRSLAGRTAWVPVAPLAAVMVIVLVVGMARLAFTGAVHFPAGSAVTSGDEGAALNAVGHSMAGHSAVSHSAAGGGPGSKAGRASGGARTAVAAKPTGAVLVVEGFGSNCCNAANTLRAEEPGLVVRQFSYQGLNASGQPIPYQRAGNLTIQALGDRMAAQLEDLYRQVHVPVDVVAESEGTLGLYAMLVRHPDVPVKSVTLLSPIIEPDQLGQAEGTVPGAALATLNNLVGGMSPYGSSGAGALIDSVSMFGARYFEEVSRDHSLPWLAVIPLADAVTLPVCSWPRNVFFVDGFHGGLLGNTSARHLVEAFLAGKTAAADRAGQRQLRGTAQLIAAAATAWRMPELRSVCPG